MWLNGKAIAKTQLMLRRLSPKLQWSIMHLQRWRKHEPLSLSHWRHCQKTLGHEKTLTPLYLRHRSIQLETSYDIITLWQYRGPLKSRNVLSWNNKLQRSWVTREWTILSTGFDMRTCPGRQLPGQECKYVYTNTYTVRQCIYITHVCVYVILNNII